MMKQRRNGRSRASQVARNTDLALRRNPRSEMISHPPQIDGLELRHSATLRFRAIAAFNAAITFQNLLDTMLVATTAVAGTDLFQTVRIRRVRVWGIAAIGAATSVSVEFSGVTAGIVGDQAIHTDTSVGVQPAHVDARPSRRSLAAEYQLNSAANAFILQIPAGGVVDVELSFRSQLGFVNTAAQNALVGATAGAQYLRGLDGVAIAATNFLPEYTVGQI